MRRQVLLVAAWLGGGAVAVLLANAAVGRVGNEVTGSRPAPLSAAEVREELAAEQSTTTTLAGGPTASSTTETTVGSTPTTSVTAPTGSTSTIPSETRTYPLVGGTATLRFSPSGVTVVVANPNSGFAVEVEPYGPNGVEVSFESDSFRSKVEAFWDGGPHDEVDERPRD